MLYHLLYPLAEAYGAFNVVRYITFRTAAATLTSLFICFVVGPWLIRRLSALRVGQPIREIGPESLWRDPASIEARNCMLRCRNHAPLLDGIPRILEQVRAAVARRVLLSARVLDVPAALAASKARPPARAASLSRRAQSSAGSTPLRIAWPKTSGRRARW